jgi:hypothetical protein
MRRLENDRFVVAIGTDFKGFVFEWELEIVIVVQEVFFGSNITVLISGQVHGANNSPTALPTPRHISKIRPYDQISSSLLTIKYSGWSFYYWRHLHGMPLSRYT